MLELFDAGSDGSSDESVAGSPVPSSLAKPDNSSFDEPFPFPVDKSDDPSIPGSADTSVISTETGPDQPGHSPIVSKPGLPRSILRKRRLSSEEVNPLKFLHDADESARRSDSSELSLSRAGGSIPLSVSFCDTTTVYTTYDPDEDPSHKPDLDGIKGVLRSDAKVRRDFEDLWKFNEWRHFRDPFTNLGPDASALDRRRQTAMRMIQIDVGIRSLVRRVENKGHLYPKSVNEDYECFVGATEQLRLSLEEDPSEEPTPEEMRECHQYLYDDLMIVFKALEWNDKIEELKTLRLLDGK